jgi:ribonuclease VapC
MTYATAALSREPLLAVDDDFPRSDLESDGVIGYWPTPTVH